MAIKRILSYYTVSPSGAIERVQYDWKNAPKPQNPAGTPLFPLWLVQILGPAVSEAK